jgi:hypothetical protein
MSQRQCIGTCIRSVVTDQTTVEYRHQMSTVGSLLKGSGGSLHTQICFRELLLHPLLYMQGFCFNFSCGSSLTTEDGCEQSLRQYLVKTSARTTNHEQQYVQHRVCKFVPLAAHSYTDKRRQALSGAGAVKMGVKEWNGWRG